MPAAKDAPELIFKTDHHAVGFCGPVLTCIWRKETTSLGVKHLQLAHDQLKARCPGGIALFTIIEAHAPAPPSDVRGALAKYMSSSGDVIRCSAVAFEGTGFHAAMIRSVVTGLTMIARQPFPHKVFASVEEGARWMDLTLEQLGPAFRVEADRLLSAIFELRARVRAVDTASTAA